MRRTASALTRADIPEMVLPEGHTLMLLVGQCSVHVEDDETQTGKLLQLSGSSTDATGGTDRRPGAAARRRTDR